MHQSMCLVPGSVHLTQHPGTVWWPRRGPLGTLRHPERREVDLAQGWTLWCRVGAGSGSRPPGEKKQGVCQWERCEWMSECWEGFNFLLTTRSSRGDVSVRLIKIWRSRGLKLWLLDYHNSATAWQNQQNDLCAQLTLRSAWASIQTDQSLRNVLNW